MGKGMPKGRSAKTYNTKLRRLKKWHSNRVNARKSWSKERLEKAKPLKPLDWYVKQLKQSNARR